MQTELNFEAIKERDAGIRKVEKTADAIDPAWRDEAYELLKRFLSEVPGKFMVEDVRAYAAMYDFVEPASKRIWGSIIRRAVKDGLVRGAGYGRTTNPKAHSTPANLWMPVKQAS